MELGVGTKWLALLTSNLKISGLNLSGDGIQHLIVHNLSGLSLLFSLLQLNMTET